MNSGLVFIALGMSACNLVMSSLGLVFGTVVYAYTYIYIYACLVYCTIYKRILHSVSVSYGFSRNILSSYSTLWYIVASCSVVLSLSRDLQGWAGL